MIIAHRPTFVWAETCRYSLLDLMTICLLSPCLSQSGDVILWTSAMRRQQLLGSHFGVDGKLTQIIRVKSLLLPLCPVCPMITKETCQWDSRVYSYSMPAPSELVGTTHSLGQSKSQSTWSELKGEEDTRERREETG